MIAFIFIDCSAQTVTIHQSNVSLESVIKEITKQTGYVFFYKKNLITSFKSVDADFEQQPVKNVLSLLLQNKKLEFEFFEKTIVIKSLANLSNDGHQMSVSGIVTDENNLPLKNVIAEMKTVDLKAQTNDEGKFRISGILAGNMTISAKGFEEKEVVYKDTIKFYPIRLKPTNLTRKSIDLNEVTISSADQLKQPEKFVDLTNRSYMNLSQVLQGTIPGLSLQLVTISNKQITSVDVFENRDNSGHTLLSFVRMSVPEFLNFLGAAKAQEILDILLAGNNVPEAISKSYRINVTANTVTALVPQIRGANNFSNNLSNMLVVIDGFPQDGFPADYPMTNVESIEVVKDQAILVKWGPKASGGLILIKTKSAKKGRINVTYSSTFYYSPKQKYDRKALGLASTSDYLDYLHDVDVLFPDNYTNFSSNFTPAARLFAQKRLNLISQQSYQRKLDSLKSLDNQSQIALLQQNSFNQSHTVGLSGGISAYRFNLTSTYSSNQSNGLGSYDNALAFNLNNDFLLLKNKLRINWLINYTDRNSRSGSAFSLSGLPEPYQMLLDANGNYLYDYQELSPYANDIITSKGYYNYGINLLEDARADKTLTGTKNSFSNLNMNWDILDGLTFASSFMYKNVNSKIDNSSGRQSSVVRRLVDNYGTYNANGVNFYVPYGDILRLSSAQSQSYTLRNDLLYSKTFGSHTLKVTVGGGVASNITQSPNQQTVYGYDAATNTSSPVYLPSQNPQGGISNFNQFIPNATNSLSYPYTLLQPLKGDSLLTRNVNFNTTINYKYSDRLFVSGSLIKVFSPVRSQTLAYATTENYLTDITGLVFKTKGKLPHKISVAAGITGIQLPDLPAIYNNLRYQQANYQNYAIWVNSLLPTQLSGQSSQTYYQKLKYELGKGILMFNLGYNTQKIAGDFSNLSANPAQNSGRPDVVNRYLSADLATLLRKGSIVAQATYSKSPEGKTQINGFGAYDIAHESYFHSKLINTLEIGFKMQDISSFQGLTSMLGTNVSSNGSYSQAVNVDFGVLPPNNTNYEFHLKTAINNDAQTLDLRYYNQSTSGLNNFTPVTTDPASGVSTRTTYSKINNHGIEFYLKSVIVNRNSLIYNITLNGAFNTSVVHDAPTIPFSGLGNYSTAHRNGYAVNSLFSVKSAGLNSSGDPQIYNAKGEKTAILDTATIVSSLVYSGVTRAPWTGGLIHELNYKNIFFRTTMVFNLGYVMRTYIPYPTNNAENNVLIKDRWRKPGDEEYTDVPKLIQTQGNTFRSYVTQNGTNSITSANNIRLQEIVIGAYLPKTFISRLGISSATVSLQVQNVAAWYHNSLNVDPVTVGVDGRIGLPISKQYSFTLNVTF